MVASARSMGAASFEGMAALRSSGSGVLVYGLGLDRCPELASKDTHLVVIVAGFDMFGTTPSTTAQLATKRFAICISTYTNLD